MRVTCNMTLVLALMLGSSPIAAVTQDAAGSLAEQFLTAVTKGDLETVKVLLQKDRTLASARDASGVSAVMKGVYYGQTAVVEHLLSTGLELNMFEAAATGRTERVSQLLKTDASLANAAAPDGFFPLGLAIFFGHPDTVKVLLAAGADVNAASKNAMAVMPIHSAAAAHQLEVARWLVDRGANVNARQQGGFTPLHEAASTGQLDLAKLLIEHGADVNARTTDGKTALTFALLTNHPDIAAHLRKHGATQ